MKYAKRLMMFVAVAIMMFSTVALAGGNGSHVNVDRSAKSRILIIGDSRICGCATANPNTVSYNAVVGGTWGSKKSNLYISQTKYLNEQKEIVKKILKKHKKAIVVIAGTVNDARDRWKSPKLGYQLSVDSMHDTANALKKLAGKGQSVTIYYTSAIPKKNKDAEVKDLNALIKSKSPSGHYIDLGQSATWKKYYGDDNTHFSPAGKRLNYSKIMDGIASDLTFEEIVGLTIATATGSGK